MRYWRVSEADIIAAVESPARAEQVGTDRWNVWDSPSDSAIRVTFVHENGTIVIVTMTVTGLRTRPPR